MLVRLRKALPLPLLSLVRRDPVPIEAHDSGPSGRVQGWTRVAPVGIIGSGKWRTVSLGGGDESSREVRPAAGEEWERFFELQTGLSHGDELSQTGSRQTCSVLALTPFCREGLDEQLVDDGVECARSGGVVIDTSELRATLVIGVAPRKVIGQRGLKCRRVAGRSVQKVEGMVKQTIKYESADLFRV
jgi:hypothetical protein